MQQREFNTEFSSLGIERAVRTAGKAVQDGGTRAKPGILDLSPGPHVAYFLISARSLLKCPLGKAFMIPST